MIEAGIYTLVSNNAQIAALCAARIYPDVLPTGPTYPAMTYMVPAIKSSPTFNTSGMQRLRVQFDCFGSTAADAIAMRDAVRVFLNGYQGLLSDGTLVQNVELIQIGSDFLDAARIYRRMIEFYFYFNFSS